jgi:hypothetical protein
MGLEKLDFKIAKRYFGKSFGHILKANDVEHHISQMQSDLTILKAPKREMKRMCPKILPKYRLSFSKSSFSKPI